jgi:hypothetical protein
MHDDLLNLAYPDVKVPLSDYLAVLQTSKRRVQEGYSLDCAKNKAIVFNDPWLVDVWTLIDRMDAHASGDGMVGNGLDLKYLGVSSIWTNELTMYDERLIDPDAHTSHEMFSDAVLEIVTAMDLPAFEGVATQYPENRQLCLSLCGWSLGKPGVQQNCEDLVENGEIYKAIVLAVFQGHKDIALHLLRTTLQANRLPRENINLAAVIACASPSSGVSPEQREACAWMSDMTSDPYLKSLLAYLITGDWSTVADMPQLSLHDRVAVALKYLSDSDLTTFLATTTSTAIAAGDPAGLLLTGLTTRALDLLAVHISHHPTTGLQSAVLVLSRACPLYIQDARFSLWKDIYLEHMQTFRTFLQRTRYTKEHNKLSVTRAGTSNSKPSQPSLTIRCLQCQQNLSLRSTGPSQANKPARLLPAHTRPAPKPKSAPPQNLSCPTCGAQMPRCGLCMLWLGSPDPSKSVGAYETLQGEDKEARLMVFCMSCTHGFHGHHARDWFARHAMCPVPDCGCMCGLLK